MAFLSSWSALDWNSTLVHTGNTDNSYTVVKLYFLEHTAHSLGLVSVTFSYSPGSAAHQDTTLVGTQSPISSTSVSGRLTRSSETKTMTAVFFSKPTDNVNSDTIATQPSCTLDRYWLIWLCVASLLIIASLSPLWSAYCC